MSLYPDSVVDDVDGSAGISLAPSKTYFLDFASGSIQGYIDGETAIRQAIRKALITDISRPLIYDGTYGSELESLIGSNYSIAYLQSEVPRMVTDALVYDDRIDAVENINISIGGDVMYVEFTVILNDETKIFISEVVAL